MEEFGKRLRSAMEKKGMTQCDLARAVYVTPTCIHKYVKVERYPQLDTLIRICDVLEVSADWLLGRVNE